jgi:hypothetical protein
MPVGAHLARATPCPQPLPWKATAVISPPRSRWISKAAASPGGRGGSRTSKPRTGLAPAAPHDLERHDPPGHAALHDLEVAQRAHAHALADRLLQLAPGLAHLPGVDGGGRSSARPFTGGRSSSTSGAARRRPRATAQAIPGAGARARRGARGPRPAEESRPGRQHQRLRSLLRTTRRPSRRRRRARPPAGRARRRSRRCGQQRGQACRSGGAVPAERPVRRAGARPPSTRGRRASVRSRASRGGRRARRASASPGRSSTSARLSQPRPARPPRPPRRRCASRAGPEGGGEGPRGRQRLRPRLHRRLPLGVPSASSSRITPAARSHAQGSVTSVPVTSMGGRLDRPRRGRWPPPAASSSRRARL